MDRFVKVVIGVLLTISFVRVSTAVALAGPSGPAEVEHCVACAP